MSPSAPPAPPPLPPSEEAVGGELLVFAGLLVAILIGSHVIIRTRCTALPESSFAILAGVGFGIVLSRLPTASAEPFWAFEPEVFFYGLLPPIIFDAGYSLKRRLFLRNLAPILSFAVVGTLLSAVTTAGMLLLGGVFGWIDDGIFGGISSVDGVLSCLLYGALISATDAVATLAVLSAPHVNADAMLLSILFGESVLNDAVSIVLFQTLQRALSSAAPQPAVGAAVGAVVVDFLRVACGATAIGFGLALALSFTLRHGKFYEASTHIEVALTIGVAYLSYALAESLALSGVLAIFFCAAALGARRPVAASNGPSAAAESPRVAPNRPESAIHAPELPRP